MPRNPVPRSKTSRLSELRTLGWQAIEMAGGWAETSDRLSSEERDELIRLRKKSRNRRTPLSRGETAKYTSLVVKAIGAERVRGWLDRTATSVPESPREPEKVEPAERLTVAAGLRDAGVITDEDFQQLKTRYLKDL